MEYATKTRKKKTSTKIRGFYEGMAESPKIIGASEALGHCLDYVSAIAPSDAAVLIQGESGVGKELIAERIHVESARAKGKLVSVNCASVPRELFESEFFGHVKGAFTGATRDRAGRFETAHQGTLFLDEVGEIPAESQGKLLRVLQQGTSERLGNDQSRQVDVRIIAATNRNLAAEVEAGRFRRDLFYRISTFMIEVPPLRERKEDIEALTQMFLKELVAKYKTRQPKLTKSDFSCLMKHDWPGNVRELKNVIERAYVLGRTKGTLRIESALNAASPTVSQTHGPKRHSFLTAPEFANLEKQNLVAALEAANWKIYGEDGAASLLEMKPTTLASRLQTLGIRKPKKMSLYTRLGGERFVSGLARDLLGRLQADPQLGRFWTHRSNVSISREEAMLTQYLCDALGGPRPYEGGEMISVHANLGITSGDWRIFERHLQVTFDTFAISQDLRDTLTGMIGALRPKIVRL